MSDLTLKPVQERDIAFILRTQRLEMVKDFVSPTSEVVIAEGIADPNQAYLIGINDSGEPVAFAQLCGLQSEHRSIELRQFAAAVPKQGYGSALMCLVIAEAFEIHAANRLWLDVFPDNLAARALYQKFGFVEEGVLREAYLWNGDYRSAVIMSMLASEYIADSS